MFALRIDYFVDFAMPLSYDANRSGSVGFEYLVSIIYF